MSGEFCGVRQARAEDKAAVFRLYHFLADDFEAGNRAEVCWKAILREPHQTLLVYELEGKVVSTCTLVIVTNLTHAQRPWAMIENVVTDPKYRGRSFASACLAAAKAIAEEQGCYRISVMTGSKRESTLRFYKQAGYSDQIKTAFVQYLNHEKK